MKNFQNLFSGNWLSSFFNRCSQSTGRSPWFSGFNWGNWGSWGRNNGCQQYKFDSPDPETVRFEQPAQQQGCGCTQQTVQQQPVQQQGCGCSPQQTVQQQPVQQQDDCGCNPQPTQATVDNDCPGFTCRHTPTKPTVPTQPTVPTCTCPEPTPEPTPTCTCPEPTPTPTPTVPTCTCPPVQTKPVCPPAQPAPPSENIMANINTGIIDGPGNDVYDGQGNDVYAWGNSGIIDTSGNDTYAQNISYNTFNTVNNFYEIKTQPTIEPTPTSSPTIEPTPTSSPTIEPTPTSSPTIEPTPTSSPTIEPTPTSTVDPPSPTKSTEGPTVNLTPLRNFLTGMESLKPDGVLSDAELNKAINNPHYADIDGDDSKISSEEMAIFNKIKAFNQDKNLISDVLKGDYSNISDDTLEELGALSDEIKNLKNR